MGKLSDKKVAFLIAPKDFRDEEYFQPKVILQAQGAQISTLSKGDLDEVTGIKGGKAHTDAKLENLTPENYDALIIVGGKGVKTYFNDKQIHQILIKFNEAQKPIGAICSAPVVLANAGILKNKKATSFKDDKITLEKQKVNWQDSSTIVDGNIVTAQGSRQAMIFGQKIAKLLIS